MEVHGDGVSAEEMDVSDTVRVEEGDADAAAAITPTAAVVMERLFRVMAQLVHEVC